MNRSDELSAGSLWFWATAIAAALGVAINALAAYGNEAGHFSPGMARFFNTLAFFTILANTLVAVFNFQLARGNNASELRFRILRTTALIAITITGIVYHTLLRDYSDLDGWALVGDLIAHSIVPLMAIAGYFAFGPRQTIQSRTVWLALIFPVVWSIFTLMRGEIVSWYPYPFMDVDKHGYRRVFVNMAGIAIAFWLVGSAYRLADQCLADRRTAQSARTAM